MKINRCISVISCLLLCSQHLEFQNSSTSKSIESLSYPSTVQKALGTSDHSTASSSNSTVVVTKISFNTTSSTETIRMTPGSPQTFSTSNQIQTGISAQTPLSTSISSRLFMSSTRGAQIIETSQTVNGKYSSKVRIKCLFPDQYRSEYSNNKSPVLIAYLQALVDKFAIELFRRSMLLVRAIVFTVTPGSVVVDMALHLRSDIFMNDTLLMATVSNSVIAAYNGVTILSIRVLQSSRAVNNKGKWIIGLIFALVIAVVLIIVALLLFYRYYPQYLCCCSKSKNNQTSAQSEGPETMVEMEFENNNDDRDAIIDRGSSRV